MKKINLLWATATIVAATVVGCCPKEDINPQTKKPTPDVNASETLTSLKGTEWTYHDTGSGHVPGTGDYDIEVYEIYYFDTDSTGYYTFDITDNLHPIESETSDEVDDFKMMLDYSFDTTTGIITLQREDYKMGEANENGLVDIYVISGEKTVEEALILNSTAKTLTHSTRGRIFYRTK